MRPIFTSLGLTVVLALAGISGSGVRSFAAEEAWTGTLTDATCGKSHKQMAQGQFTDTECTNACAELGKFALIVGDKVFELANKLDSMKVLAAQNVKVTGELNKAGLIVATAVEEAK